MFGKISKREVYHHLNKAKYFIGKAYTNTKNFLGDVDQGVRTFKHIYGAVAPILDSYGIKSDNKHIIKAISGYDNIRNSVMENHDRVVNDLHKVKNSLRSRKFDIS